MVAVKDRKQSGVDPFAHPEGVVAGIGLGANGRPRVGAIDGRAPEEDNRAAIDAQIGGMAGVHAQQVLERAGRGVDAAQKGRIGLEEHRDLEAARCRFVEQGGQVRFGLVGVTVRAIPGDDQRIDAGGLGLVDVPAHDATVAAGVWFQRLVAQAIRRPTGFVEPRVVEGQHQAVAHALLRRRRMGDAARLQKQAEQSHQEQQDEGDENAPSQVRRGLGRFFDRRDQRVKLSCFACNIRTHNDRW